MQIAIHPALHSALRACSDIERQIVAISRRRDAQRKFDLVHWRRKFAEQLGEIGPLIDHDDALLRQPEKMQEMNRLFSTFRYAIGQHQASWPAVRIDEDEHAYAESARETHIKSDRFWNWCTQNLAFSRL
ncbi:MAG TPA: hypothetical protein VFF89_11335 [Sphingobium sp.]|nr:hypothetical protein [Sphingobium sp.]